MAVNFIDEAGSDLNKFIMTREDGTEETVYLRRDATITQVGTPLNAENLNKLQSDMLAAIATQAEAVYYGVCSQYSTSGNNSEILTNLDNFDKTKVSLVVLTSSLTGYSEVGGISKYNIIRNSSGNLGYLIINNRRFCQLPTNAKIVCLWDKTYFRVIHIDGEYSLNANGLATYNSRLTFNAARSGNVTLNYPSNMTGATTSGIKMRCVATPQLKSSSNSFVGGGVYSKNHYCWYGNGEDDKVNGIDYTITYEIDTYSL